jgi:hypothetical protein
MVGKVGQENESESHDRNRDHANGSHVCRRGIVSSPALFIISFLTSNRFSQFLNFRLQPTALCPSSAIVHVLQCFVNLHDIQHLNFQISFAIISCDVSCCVKRIHKVETDRWSGWQISV